MRPVQLQGHFLTGRSRLKVGTRTVGHGILAAAVLPLATPQLASHRVSESGRKFLWYQYYHYHPTLQALSSDSSSEGTRRHPQGVFHEYSSRAVSLSFVLSDSIQLLPLIHVRLLRCSGGRFSKARCHQRRRNHGINTAEMLHELAAVTHADEPERISHDKPRRMPFLISRLRPR